MTRLHCSRLPFGLSDEVCVTHVDDTFVFFLFFFLLQIFVRFQIVNDWFLLQALKEHFSQFGKVRDARIMLDRSYISACINDALNVCLADIMRAVCICA